MLVVPRIRCNDDTVEAKLGGNTTLICHIQSNPGSQLRWMQGSQRKQIVTGRDDFVIIDKVSLNVLASTLMYSNGCWPIFLDLVGFTVPV